MKRQDYLSWDEYFMGLALLSAERSKDPSTQVGACIVNPELKIVSVGYNGAPKGYDDGDIIFREAWCCVRPGIGMQVCRYPSPSTCACSPLRGHIWLAYPTRPLSGSCCAQGGPEPDSTWSPSLQNTQAGWL